MNFRDILGMSNKRRMRLIEKLYFNQDGMPSDQLMSELECSLPILLEDVRWVNDQYHYFHIEKYKGLYRMSVQDRVSIGTLYADILIQSPEFQIIEQLLYEECDNITNLADRVYLSVSNTQRYLKKVKVALDEAGMQLCYRPLRIEGKESVIRHFYYRYFIEKQNAFENILPMLKDDQFNSIEQFVIEFIEKNGLYRKYIFQKRLIYTIYISLWRKKNGHDYPKNELRKGGFILPDTEYYEGLNKTTQDLFHIQLSDEVVRDCMWPIYADAVIFSIKHRNMALSDNPRYQIMYQRHFELVEEFNKLTGGKLDQRALIDVTTVLVNDFYLYNRKGAFVSILRRSRDTFLAMASVMYKKPIKRVSEIVQRFVNKYNMYQEDDCVKNYVYLLLTAEGGSTLRMLVEHDQTVRLLLLSDLTPTEEDFLAEDISRRVLGNFKIFCFEHVVNRKNGMYEEMLNYDGLITTGSVEGLPEDFPVIVMGPYVTQQTLISIQNLVNDLSLRN
ncbi:helix-turn-helix domain-containing protein [Enterococcus sp. AZ109]|uniref:helix-turn-helix domain-containing protein n=1 Tax=Enterococcus sp. AZ109 TaxID=2774634 RepID=UPI003F212F73